MNDQNPNVIDESSMVELSLLEILGLLKKNWFMIVCLTLLAGGLAYGYTKFFIDPTYQSSSTVFIQPKVNENQVSYNELLTNQRLIDTYTQIAKSNLVLTEVAKEFKSLGYDKEEIAKAISVSSISDTEIIRFSVVTDDPALSSRITNKVVEVFISKVNTIMELNNLTVIDKAIVNDTPVGPRTLFNTAIGALIGLMGAVFIVFVRHLLNNTLKTRTDVERTLGIPVLGEIYFND
jgi:capsular polysaccharide biosynthesis protein